MKNKFITTLMLSSVVLMAAVPFGAVKADSTDEQIARQDATIEAAKNSSAAAQTKVDEIKTKIESLQTKKISITNEVNKLIVEQQQQSDKIANLHKNIKERNAALEAQARSAQTNGTATNYMSTILDSKSLTDAIQKMTAIATVSGANKAMLEKQQEDEKAIQSKLKDNESKYAKSTKLEQELEAQSAELASQEAALKVAQLSYQSTIENSESKKQNLLDQKATAAKQAADAVLQQERVEKAAQEANKAQKEQSNVNNNNNKVKMPNVTDTTTTPVVTKPIIENNNPTSSENTDKNTSNDNSNSNTSGGAVTPPSNAVNPYPWGQCTWGVWEYFGGKVPTYAGNASDWVVYANSGPAVGTIAVFPAGNQGAGGLGHVAVVTAVNGDKLTVSETNFSGPNGGGLGIRTTREVSAAGVSFIRP